MKRTIRSIALGRDNAALFAGYDAEVENWATIASLIETCKLNAVDPFDYLSAALISIVNSRRQSQITELMPWTFCAGQTARVFRQLEAVVEYLRDKTLVHYKVG